MSRSDVVKKMWGIIRERKLEVMNNTGLLIYEFYLEIHYIKLVIKQSWTAKQSFFL